MSSKQINFNYQFLSAQTFFIMRLPAFIFKNNRRRSIIAAVAILISFILISCKPDERIDLTGGWRMQIGDSSAYKESSFDDSSWQLIDLPRILTPLKTRKTIWLRKTFTVPSAYSGIDLALEIGKIWDSDNTYINGIKIGSSGTEFPDFFSLWNYDRYYIIPEKTLRYGETNLISIRIFSNCLAFFEGDPFIASHRSVRTFNFFKRLSAEYIVIGLTLLSAFFGIISLVQYISYRKFTMPLYYSICSLLIGMMSIEFYLPDLAFFTYITKDNIFYSVMTLVIAFFYFLIENLLYTRNRFFQGIVIIAMFAAVTISLTSTADDPVQSWRISVIGALTFLVYILCGILLVRAFITKATKEVVILSIGYIINMLFVFHDIFMMINIITPGTFLIPVAFNILYVCFGMVLSLRTSEAHIEKKIAEQARDYYVNEINLAKKIQEKLIPATYPADYIHALYKPMEKVGGDFYDFISFKDSEKIGIFISDVSGHGLQAAFITSMIKMTILQSGVRRENPAELLHYINEVLQDQTADNFITAFYGIYNPSDRTFRYANAGHPPPFVITEESITHLQKGRNTALALFPNSLLYELNKSFIDFEIELPADSRLLLFTDGLIEISPLKTSKLSFDSVKMEEFFIDHKKYVCRQFIENLYHKLVEFRGSDFFEDDICLVCLDIS